MEDYPRDLLEFESRFATEEACRDYLFALRWPDGFRCPSCGHERAWPVRKVWFECARCGRQTSVTAGTIFQDTRKPLRLLVPGDVARRLAEERGQRAGFAARFGTGQLPNRLDLDA